MLSSMCAAFADNKDFSFTPGKEDKPGVEELDIDEYMQKTVTQIYKEIKSKIDNCTYKRRYADDNRIEVIKDDDTGMIRRLCLKKGNYGSKYNKYFYYDKDENLVFVHYDSKDNGSHRMYVYDGTMVHWKDSTGKKSVKHQMENTEEYLEVQEMILAESEELLEIAKGRY
jgi:hypothetical protein